MGFPYTKDDVIQEADNGKKLILQKQSHLFEYVTGLDESKKTIIKTANQAALDEIDKVVEKLKDSPQYQENSIAMQEINTLISKRVSEIDPIIKRNSISPTYYSSPNDYIDHEYRGEKRSDLDIDEINALTKQISDLSKQLDTCRGEGKLKDDEINDNVKKITKLTDELNNSIGIINGTKGALQSVNAEKAAAEEKVAELKAKLAQEERKYRKKDEYARNLAEEMEQVKSTARQTSDKLKEKEKEVIKLAQSIGKKNAEIIGLRTQIVQLESKNDAALKQKNKDLAQAQGQLVQAQEQVAALKLSLEAGVADIAKLQKNLGNQTNLYNKLDNKYKSLNEFLKLFLKDLDAGLRKVLGKAEEELVNYNMSKDNLKKVLDGDIEEATAIKKEILDIITRLRLPNDILATSSPLTKPKPKPQLTEEAKGDILNLLEKDELETPLAEPSTPQAEPSTPLAAPSTTLARKQQNPKVFTQEYLLGLGRRGQANNPATLPMANEPATPLRAVTGGGADTVRIMGGALSNGMNLLIIALMVLFIIFFIYRLYVYYKNVRCESVNKLPQPHYTRYE